MMEPAKINIGNKNKEFSHLKINRKADYLSLNDKLT